MKHGLATLVGLGAVAFMTACDSYEDRYEAREGVVISKIYDERVDNCVLRVKSYGTTNTFMIVKGRHASFTDIHTLAKSLEVGDTILFLPHNIPDTQGIGQVYVNNISKKEKENVKVQK